jgi:hypothetical protein
MEIKNTASDIILTTSEDEMTLALIQRVYVYGFFTDSTLAGE